ncbi:A disintegrin and metalloproteinase with thrombospondin motifs 9-like [Mya arenaria]|uniref:A disintegrin and metalloproteinase with thrombospondin motifs 9-like n=1 Tax=Mya arenaria TaxID=6604 RepID=UPI0022E8CFA9|nr:A disintegrin and metalloproteinase with thrombospondin motifs 9-like [Mya arenaria]
MTTEECVLLSETAEGLQDHLNVLHRFYCGRPPPPPKGYTRNIAGTSHGSLTTYTCSRYYIQANLSGPTIECLLNNSWSKPDYSNSLCRKPSSCEEVLQCQPAYTDGEYWLYPLHLQLVKDTKVKVYCHSMASGSPDEYITVDPTQNYGHNAGKDNGAEKVTAYFNKIRNLQVIITDSTFASATYHYAAADDCRCNIGCPPRKGYFKVHTIGTGLKFGPLAEWFARGWYPQIEHWYQSEDNTTFSANCGGYCGGCRPVDDTLPLIPNDQEVLPDNSAVVPSCA